MKIYDLASALHSVELSACMIFIALSTLHGLAIGKVIDPSSVRSLLRLLLEKKLAIGRRYITQNICNEIERSG